jgi:hypothetical protein
MYKTLIESILVIVLACLGIFDAWRLGHLLRSGHTFHDVVGPDRYLAVISVGLLICGIWNLTSGLKSRGLQQHGKVTGERGGAQINQVVLVVFLLAVYTLVIPTFGYLPATAMFFPIIYFIFGVRPWPKSIVVGLITTALFYFIFEYFAEMPLPKGIFKNLL